MSQLIEHLHCKWWLVRLIFNSVVKTLQGIHYCLIFVSLLILHPKIIIIWIKPPFNMLWKRIKHPFTLCLHKLTFILLFYRSNSPLKKAADDWNPCSRVTVLSALKESRKRSFLVEDDEEEFMRPTKRCFYLDCNSNNNNNIHVHCRHKFCSLRVGDLFWGVEEECR